jgi:hypothetical protein
MILASFRIVIYVICKQNMCQDKLKLDGYMLIG